MTTAELPDLDERQERFLARVVKAHVETARPVGSRLLSRLPDVRISSASIRAVLAELERAGCLYRPHTSAGRVPTDAGYRYFVDRLMRRHPPAMGERAVLRRLFGLSGVWEDPGATTLTAELARLTHQLAIAVGEGARRVRYSGVRNMVEQPEFARAQDLAPIFGLLDEGTLLGRSLAMLAAGGSIRIWIGRENPIEAMRGCALVAMRPSGSPMAAIGVLGPIRMDYAGVVGRLSLLGDIVEEGSHGSGM